MGSNKRLYGAGRPSRRPTLPSAEVVRASREVGSHLSWPDTNCPGINANPLLGPLQDNGGATDTALASGSGALNVAVLANCPSTDQRGTTRPQGAGCDIGAYELEEPPAVDD